MTELHVHTLLVLFQALALLESFAAVLIWSGHRNIAALRWLAAAYVLAPMALLLLPDRSDLSIVVNNSIICMVNLLLVISVAEMTQRPFPYKRSIMAVLAGSLAFWSVALATAPDQLLIRVVVRTLFDAAAQAWMLRNLLPSTVRPAPLRHGLSFCLTAQASAHILRIVLAIIGGNEGLKTELIPAWYLITIMLFSDAEFIFLAVLALQTAKTALSHPVNLNTDSPNTEWQFDSTAQELTPPGGEAIKLTSMELCFMTALLKSPFAPSSRDALFSAMPRTSTINDHNLDSMVGRFRQKVRTACGQQLPVKAVYGVGYALTAPIHSRDQVPRP